MFCRNLFPGRLDQDVIYGERLEILLPVVDPILILGLGDSNCALADIDKLTQIIESFLNVAQKVLEIAQVFEIEAHLCSAIVRRKFRENVDKHALRVCLRQRYVILDLNALNTKLIEHTAD